MNLTFLFILSTYSTIFSNLLLSFAFEFIFSLLCTPFIFI